MAPVNAHVAHRCHAGFVAQLGLLLHDRDLKLVPASTNCQKGCIASGRAREARSLLYCLCTPCFRYALLWSIGDARMPWQCAVLVLHQQGSLRQAGLHSTPGAAATRAAQRTCSRCSSGSTAVTACSSRLPPMSRNTLSRPRELHPPAWPCSAAARHGSACAAGAGSPVLVPVGAGDSTPRCSCAPPASRSPLCCMLTAHSASSVSTRAASLCGSASTSMRSKLHTHARACKRHLLTAALACRWRRCCMRVHCWQATLLL
jgi:hypothetical protein